MENHDSFNIPSPPNAIDVDGEEPRKTTNIEATRLMEDYSRNSGYLINLSQAVGRLVLAGRDLTRFAGYTHRVCDFLDVLEDVGQGRYRRSMVSSDPSGISDIRTIDEARLAGRIIWEEGVISFTDVPICTPNGDVMVPSLTLRLDRGMHCLVTGPNGCGKSSLFRILGGLWPLFGGTLIKPPNSCMFYVPQKPYLSLGTLREQIIYPHTREMAIERGFDDDELQGLLETVNLAYLVDRSGENMDENNGTSSKDNELKETSGWETVCDWTDVLSGGEKQRVAMARLFYHKPDFAILDECTSAVSLDIEGKIYRHAKELGVTLFTISHRPSLLQYHNYLLKFDGVGGYKFGPLVNDLSNVDSNRDGISSNSAFQFQSRSDHSIKSSFESIPDGCSVHSRVSNCNEECNIDVNSNKSDGKSVKSDGVRKINNNSPKSNEPMNNMNEDVYDKNIGGSHNGRGSGKTRVGAYLSDN